MSQTLPYQTKYLCVEGQTAAIFFWVAIGIAVCTIYLSVKQYAELKNNGSAQGLFFNERQTKGDM